ncbi:hypothetical protein TSUD_321240 [Trifolium subterraneum]|uniref:ATP-dependent DNA helicase n=1 Tax=Trifolium subterraneum TaxID=3900 RepID=A0A2Z6MPI6_TRISU|nr:hypothetical protein TSUD_321240 [Trifolium subterraneum]
MISAINDVPRNRRLIVRVVRLWGVLEFNTPNQFRSLELVLMDSEGTMIHCSVKKTLIYLFQKQLSEGVVYTLTTFDVLHTKLIIWDEAQMMHMYCFEAVDRTLCDITGVKNRPFGGKVVVLGGDFRQILPVVRRGSRQHIVSTAVNSSKIWESCKVLRLAKNMRLARSNDNSNTDSIQLFGEWLLSIGDGYSKLDECGEYDIDIPDDLLIKDCANPLQELVDFAYLQQLQNISSKHYFEERGILAPTLDSLQEVNEYIMSQILGEEKEYCSADSVCKSDKDSDVTGEWFTTKFLNEIKCSRLPNHKLRLKENVSVMLMRNIDQARGLCNGTRLLVNYLGKSIIGATVLTGTNIGDKIVLSRKNLIPLIQDYLLNFKGDNLL